MTMALDQFKIFDGVVDPVYIDMMDDFCLGKLPSDVLFHYMPMFKDSSPEDSDFSVPIAVDSAIPIRPSCRNQRISEPLEPLVMDVTKSFGFMGKRTSRNCAGESSLAPSLPLLNSWVSILPASLEMHGAHIPTARFSVTSGYGTFFGHQKPPLMDYVLFCGITYPAERRNGKHRVNSGNPKSIRYGNPERSQEYTPGTCRDYRRSQVSLITGMSARAEKQEIVHSSWKHENKCNRTDPEKIFIVAYNDYSTASLTNGQSVIWDYAGSANGVGVTKPTASNEAGGKHGGAAFAGIAAETIASGAYGLIQVYGYHSAVRVRSITGGAPAVAAGVVLSQVNAVFCLESFSLSVAATSTATQHFFHAAGFALAAQASFTTKAVACFIKAL